MLTLFTTPVIYLYLDRAQQWLARRRATRASPAGHGAASAE
jgi:lipopolysaccharide export system protein LptC